MWQMCTCAPVSSASETSRSTISDSATPGMPAQSERRGVEPFVRDPVALERRILAVLDDWQAEHAGVFERPAHQQRGRDRPAIVREGDAAGRLLFAELGQLLAFRSNRHRPDRIDTREVRFGGLLEDELR